MSASYHVECILQGQSLAFCISLVAIDSCKHGPHGPYVHPHLTHFGEGIGRVVVVEYLAVMSFEQFFRSQKIFDDHVQDF